MNADKDVISIFDLLFRYLFIVLIGLGNLYLFYLVLTPLTLWGGGFLLNIFYDAVVSDSGFFVNGVFFELVSACVGGAAFYLLFILVMSSRGIDYVKRLKMIGVSFLLLYIFNVLRIGLMVYINGAFYFYFVHWFFWYFISTLFVVLLWFWMAWLFKVKSIPVYSDFLFLLRSVRGKVGRKGKRRDRGKVKRVSGKNIKGKK